MINLLVADDHTIFREGLKQILAEQEDMSLLGEAANGDALLENLQTTRPDVVLLDLSMPGCNGIALVRAVCEAPGSHRTVVLSMHEEHQYVAEALKAGAAGYVTKRSAAHQLLTAIRKVAAGGMFVSADAALTPGVSLSPPTSSHALPHMQLTPREREIFDLLITGKKLSNIARDLNLSVKTVSTYKANVLVKMNAQATADLVRYALRHNLG